MKSQITVITAIRNREPWRIQTMVESIRQTGANPCFHIIDYGSSVDYTDKYKNLCKELGIQYTHMYSEGFPWNKCRALNFGAKQAKTPFIVTSDVDMIYEGNSLKWCLDNYKEKNIFHIETYWLDKKKKNAKFAGTGNSGGFCFTSKEAFYEINGYDERIQYWGYEDLDWPERLIKCGYTQIWLPSEYKIFHQWHEPSEQGLLRPVTVNYNSLGYCTQNKIFPKWNDDWGKNITRTDRPILKYIETIQPEVFFLKHNEITEWKKHSELIEFITKNKFSKIELATRIKKTPLARFQNFARKLISLFAKIFGWNIVPILNYDIDYLYEILLLLYPTVIKDFYINTYFDNIYILSK